MTIREAVPGDAEELVAYIHRLDSEPDSMIPRGPGEFLVTVEQERALLTEYAASDNAVYLVAEADGHVVGCLSCTGGKRRATRHNADFGMSVAPEWRNKGIGMALLSRLVAWAEGTGILRRLELEVYAHNAPALHLYRKFGFIEEGRRQRGYFQSGRFIDGILMARLLPPEPDEPVG
jgi:RimJ/RimL family protein N-acetyltransferase